jgi:hypothetical protein
VTAVREWVHTGHGAKSELTCFVEAEPHANVCNGNVVFEILSGQYLNVSLIGQFLLRGMQMAHLIFFSLSTFKKFKLLIMEIISGDLAKTGWNYLSPIQQH